MLGCLDVKHGRTSRPAGGGLRRPTDRSQIWDPGIPRIEPPDRFELGEFEFLKSFSDFLGTTTHSNSGNPGSGIGILDLEKNIGVQMY